MAAIPLHHYLFSLGLFGTTNLFRQPSMGNRTIYQLVTNISIKSLTVVLVIIIGGWNGYFSLIKISKKNLWIYLSKNYDFTAFLSISSYNMKNGK